MSFYAFLERSPQPSDQEVRETFIQKDQEWKSYCRQHQLNHNTSQWFNYEVGVSWRQRYGNAQN